MTDSILPIVLVRAARLSFQATQDESAPFDVRLSFHARFLFGEMTGIQLHAEGSQLEASLVLGDGSQLAFRHEWSHLDLSLIVEDIDNKSGEKRVHHVEDIPLAKVEPSALGPVDDTVGAEDWVLEIKGSFETSLGYPVPIHGQLLVGQEELRQMSEFKP